MFRLKKLNGNKVRGSKNEITDLFLALAGCKVMMKISLMIYPKEMEDLTFKEINEIVKKNISPKKTLIVAKQTKFISLKLEANKPIINFLHWITEVSRLKKIREEELIELRFIDVIHNT